MDFTGSDWCSWCMKLDKEVFSQAKFKEYAKQNLVLIEIDFPQLKPLSRPKQKKHDELAKQYEITGEPSVIVLDADGKSSAGSAICRAVLRRSSRRSRSSKQRRRSNLRDQ